MTSTLFHRIDLAAAVIGALVVVAWGALSSIPSAASAAIGVGLGLANFVMLRWLMARAFDATRTEMRPAGAGFIGLKFIGLAAVLDVLIVVVRIETVPFVTGLSASIVSMLSISLWSAQSIANHPAPSSEA